MAKGRAKKTNITREHKKAFNALVSGEYRNFALFSCFVNGEPSATIVAVEEEGEEVKVTPLFVAVTERNGVSGSRWKPAGAFVGDEEGGRTGSEWAKRRVEPGEVE